MPQLHIYDEDVVSPMKSAHGSHFVLLYIGLVDFTHMIQGHLADTKAIIELPQSHWRNPRRKWKKKKKSLVTS